MSLAERASREKTLIAAAHVVELCRLCAIGSTRTNSVFGEGDPCAKLMCVGEGPGEQEDRLGRPFVGRSGDLLEKMLAAIGFPVEALVRTDIGSVSLGEQRPGHVRALSRGEIGQLYKAVGL